MDALNLTKGEKIDLTKTHPGLKKIKLGLGWDVKGDGGDAFDLDAFAIILKDDKWKENKDMIYFSNKTGPGVTHSGDNLTGEGAGDDETIMVELPALQGNAVVIGANIYQAGSRRQNFGQVKNAYIKVYNADDNAVLAKYDLSEDFSGATGVILGRVYKHSEEWKFEAVGAPKTGDLNEIANTYK
jgi:tellurium resistance protein TerD